MTLARQTVHQRYTEEVFMTMTGSFLRHLLASGGVRYLKKSAWFSCLIVNLLFVALSIYVAGRLSSGAVALGIRLAATLGLSIGLCFVALSAPSEFLRRDLRAQGVSYLRFCGFGNEDFLKLGAALTLPCAAITGVSVGVMALALTQSLLISLAAAAFVCAGLVALGAAVATVVLRGGLVHAAARRRARAIVFSSNRVVCRAQRNALLAKKRALLFEVALWLCIDCVFCALQWSPVGYMIVVRFPAACILMEFALVYDDPAVKFQERYYREGLLVRALALVIPGACIATACVIATVPISLLFGGAGAVGVSFLPAVIPCCLLQLILGAAMLLVFEKRPLLSLWQTAIGCGVFALGLIEVASLVVVAVGWGRRAWRGHA